jgi:hypothetical protein
MFETPEAINASRVVFLTTRRTASASEQVINGLVPYVDVDVIGGTTLGKPVGADSWDHCGYTLAPITFHSLNAAGEGDYFQGIQPSCAAADDLLHRLGDPEEAQLKAALRSLAGEPCEADEALDDEMLGDKALSRAVPTSLAGGGALLGRFPDFPGWY